jgi:hypothetical protein
LRIETFAGEAQALQSEDAVSPVSAVSIMNRIWCLKTGTAARNLAIPRRLIVYVYNKYVVSSTVTAT